MINFIINLYRYEIKQICVFVYLIIIYIFLILFILFYFNMYYYNYNNYNTLIHIKFI